MRNKQFINGKWVESTAEAGFEQRNPADLDEITGLWPQGGREDARAAIEAAQAASAPWRALQPFRRAELFTKLLAVLQRRAEEIALLLTRENGKTLRESRGEVQSGFREMEYQVQEGVRIGGRMRPTMRDGVLAYECREPLGVVAVISPWNFPFNVPCRKVTPALMAGNTCVFKPSSLTPGVGRIFTELFEEAEFPAGVINMVVGAGSTLGHELTSAPEVRAISFTGSTEVGRRIHRVAAEGMIRTQLEMGGKNPMVVLADADIDDAAAAAVEAAYACAGQWCTSTSRVIVERTVAEDFLPRVLARVAAMRLGRGTDEGVAMGPVCGTEQLETVLRYVEIGKKEGARLCVGGSRVKEAPLARGCFVQPAVFAGVKPQMRIAREEIFGPVLSVMETAIVRRGGRAGQCGRFRACGLRLHPRHRKGHGIRRPGFNGAHARQHAHGVQGACVCLRWGEGFRVWPPGGGGERHPILHRAQDRLREVPLSAESGRRAKMVPSAGCSAYIEA